MHLEDQQWAEGSRKALKFIGYGSDICLYFSDCQSLPAATSDVHYLLELSQLSRSQATIKEFEANIDVETLSLITNHSYCVQEINVNTLSQTNRKLIDVHTIRYQH